MIRQFELMEMLEAHYPGIALKHIQSSLKNDAYKVIETFTDFACQVIRESDLERTRKILNDAYELWNEGSMEIKNAISTIFLYSLSYVIEKKPELNLTLTPLLCTDFRNELQIQHFCTYP